MNNVKVEKLVEKKESSRNFMQYNNNNKRKSRNLFV